MKQANTKKFEQRYAELCREISVLSDYGGVVSQVSENAKCRAWFGLLESIRALQISGYDAERIVNSLIEEAESRIMPPLKFEDMPEC